ncbi:ATP-binding protein [Dermabacter sp. HMSC06F07]|uniref:ATP-dependent sacrificial sulfur transferase LarE n=1 Tax=Dermabacter TaxID=36739 RepID=UPI000353B248|nr:ATP-dependent sacrificial sulfur transferase LarE [Dermabacter sp. HMSC06F07]EPH15313.1 TIGR00268 family protein [Dermabacter sp. HFH0086]MCT1708909.1 ATP-dependent sacrificial sulfur transferase LarE [Dermabacter hominis]MDU4923305.1 ATP-dependent sacrificial sulfur transferase LarE [Dermabacter sp.]MDU6927031.1 ATP-dependent sacrificial sulfur transferase LarE [Dermabacter sp.]OFT47414.1 ATP-binding protein [Dermabacter sp. HMSC06F07]
MSTPLTSVPQLTGDLAARADAAMGELAQHERVGIAYSGGVDSATLAALALRALGPDRVVALLGVSPSLARRERRIAHEVAKTIGVRVHEIETHEGERPEYVANGVDRCFFCKDELFTRIDSELLDELRLDAVAYGENADDAKRPDRPGASAATNHAVLRPLASAGLTKSDVREIARALGVPVAEKPAAPCLASRIPHGEEVTPAKLRQVEDLEDAVFDLGFSDCRARHHGRVARLELPRNELARAVEPEVRAALVAAGKAAGFAYVSLDLDGLQSGAFTLSIMNAKGTL